MLFKLIIIILLVIILININKIKKACVSAFNADIPTLQQYILNGGI